MDSINEPTMRRVDYVLLNIIDIYSYTINIIITYLNI
jgi:hypothetical protein